MVFEATTAEVDYTSEAAQRALVGLAAGLREIDSIAQCHSWCVFCRCCPWQAFMILIIFPGLHLLMQPTAHVRTRAHDMLDF